MIELRNVTKEYSKGHAALNGVSVKIERGEFVFIVGDSGSGKSTLIKLIMKELNPTEGTIIVNGQNLNRMKHRNIAKYRRGLGVVFQDFRLLKDRDVYENVAFAQRVVNRPTRVIRKRVPEVLQEVGLAGKYKAFPDELSGGEQQRIAIARVMLKNAPIIILDEATAFADPDNESRVQAAFSRLSEGKTVIMIAHRLSTVTNVDQIFVICDGQVAECGNSRELLAKDGIFSRMCGIIFSMDDAVCVFPSLHCYEALCAHLTAFASPGMRGKRRLRAASAVLVVLICLSTVFIKQHSVIDLAAGCAAAVIAALPLLLAKKKRGHHDNKTV